MNGTIRTALVVDLHGNAIGEVRVLDKEVVKANKSLKNTSRAGRDAGKGLDQGATGGSRFKRSLKSMNNEAENSTSRFKSLKSSVVSLKGAFVALLAAVVTRDLTNTVIEYEKFKGQLTTVFKGVKESATLAFTEIEKFASRTPFTLDQSVQAFVKLNNLGIRPTESRLNSFGNTAVSMGKSLNDMIEAVADASTGEFERLKEFGIKSKTQGDQVAFTFQGLTTIVRKDSASIVGYLENIGKTQFAGAMEEQMNRLPGLLSNLRDQVQGVWRSLGDKGLTNALENGLISVIGWVANIKTAVKSGLAGAWLDAIFGQWVTMFKEAFRVIGGIGEAFVSWWGVNVVTPVMEFVTGEKIKAGEGWARYFKFIGDSFLNFSANGKAAMMILIGETDKAAVQIYGAFQQLEPQLALFWEGIQRAGEMAWEHIKLGSAIAVDFIIEKFVTALASIGSALASIPGIPASWGASVTAATNSLRLLATGEEKVRAEMEATATVYNDEVRRLDQKIVLIETTTAKRVSEAETVIEMALKERDATIKATEATIAAAESSNLSAIFARNEASALDELTKGMEAAAKGADGLTESRAKSTKEAKALAAQYKNEWDALVKADQAQRDYAETIRQKTLTAIEKLEEETREMIKAHNDGVISADLLAKSLGGIQEKIDDIILADWESSIKDSEDALKDLNKESDKSIDVFKTMGETFQSALGDQLNQFFKDGKFGVKDFAKTFLDAIIRLIADVAAAWAASKIFGTEFNGVQFGGNSGNGGGFSFSGQGANNTRGGQAIGATGSAAAAVGSFQYAQDADNSTDRALGYAGTAYYGNQAYRGFQGAFGPSSSTPVGNYGGGAAPGATTQGLALPGSSTSTGLSGGGAGLSGGGAVGANAINFNGSAGALEAFGGSGSAVGGGTGGGGVSGGAAGGVVVAVAAYLMNRNFKRNKKKNAEARARRRDDFFSNIATRDFGIGSSQDDPMFDAIRGSGAQIGDVFDNGLGAYYAEITKGATEAREVVELFGAAHGTVHQEILAQADATIASTDRDVDKRLELAAVAEKTGKEMAASIKWSANASSADMAEMTAFVVDNFGTLETTSAGVSAALADGVITAAEVSKNGLIGFTSQSIVGLQGLAAASGITSQDMAASMDWAANASAEDIAKMTAFVVNKFGTINTNVDLVTEGISKGFFTATETAAAGLEGFTSASIVGLQSMAREAANTAHAIASIPGPTGRNADSFAANYSPSAGSDFIDHRAIGGLVSQRGLYELAEEGPELIFPANITSFFKREGFPVNVNRNNSGSGQVIPFARMLEIMERNNRSVDNVRQAVLVSGSQVTDIVKQSGKEQSRDRARQTQKLEKTLKTGT